MIMTLHKVGFGLSRQKLFKILAIISSGFVVITLVVFAYYNSIVFLSVCFSKKKMS